VEDGTSAGGGWTLLRASQNLVLENDMILFTAFATTFVLLIKAALATFGVFAAVVLFLFLLVSLIWSSIEGACSASAAGMARA